MIIEDIRNYLKVSDQVSSSGQPDEEDFCAIAESGFQAVVNLAMPDSDFSIPEEGSIVAEFGMTYHHIPVPFDSPSVDHLCIFFGLMESLKGRKVWVHCALNYRVSAFLYLYARWQGASADEAKKVVLVGWEPDANWRAFMGQSVESLCVTG